MVYTNLTTFNIHWCIHAMDMSTVLLFTTAHDTLGSSVHRVSRAIQNTPGLIGCSIIKWS